MSNSDLACLPSHFHEYVRANINKHLPEADGRDGYFAKRISRTNRIPRWVWLQAETELGL